MTSSAIRHNPASVWQVPDGFKSIYSHAVEVEEGARTLFISGQVGVAPDGTLPAGFASQLDQAMDNVEALLAAAGMTKADVVKANYFLTRAADLPTSGRGPAPALGEERARGGHRHRRRGACPSRISDRNRSRCRHEASRLMSTYCQVAPGHEFHGPYHDGEYGFPLAGRRGAARALRAGDQPGRPVVAADAQEARGVPQGIPEFRCRSRRAVHRARRGASAGRCRHHPQPA